MPTLQDHEADRFTTTRVAERAGLPQIQWKFLPEVRLPISDRGLPSSTDHRTRQRLDDFARLHTQNQAPRRPGRRFPSSQPRILTRVRLSFVSFIWIERRVWHLALWLSRRDQPLGAQPVEQIKKRSGCGLERAEAAYTAFRHIVHAF